MKFVLASGSPRRKALIEEMGFSPLIVLPEVEEWKDEDACPREQALHNAELKAESVCKRFPGDLVLASDTVVALESKVFNKPDDMEHAATMLMELSGKTHSVWTGVALVCLDRDISISFCEESRVTFKSLTPKIIDDYYKKIDPLDKSGSYAIQEGQNLIVEKFEGSMANVMGLPVETLLQKLKELGIFKQL